VTALQQPPCPAQEDHRARVTNAENAHPQPFEHSICGLSRHRPGLPRPETREGPLDIPNSGTLARPEPSFDRPTRRMRALDRSATRALPETPELQLPARGAVRSRRAGCTGAASAVRARCELPTCRVATAARHAQSPVRAIAVRWSGSPVRGISRTAFGSHGVHGVGQ